MCQPRSARLASPPAVLMVTRHISPHSLCRSSITAAADAGVPLRDDRRPVIPIPARPSATPGPQQPRPPRQLHRHRVHRRRVLIAPRAAWMVVRPVYAACGSSGPLRARSSARSSIAAWRTRPTANGGPDRRPGPRQCPSVSREPHVAKENQRVRTGEVGGRVPSTASTGRIDEVAGYHEGRSPCPNG